MANYCIQGNIRPVLFSPLSPSVSEDEFKTGRTPMSQTIFLYTSLYTTLSGRIQVRAKPFASGKGQK